MKDAGHRSASDRYIPAMDHDWLTPLYDPFMRLIGEEKFKRRLLKVSDIQPGHRVLDVGCGTGTLLAMIRSSEPTVSAVGVDGDLKILRIASGKRRPNSFHFALIQAMSFQLPYPDCCFDRVVSSLVFHHLNTENKRSTFQEIVRVLRPAGILTVADFGPPIGRFSRLASRLTQRHEQTSDNLRGLLPVFATEAGFSDVEMRDYSNWLFGTIWFLRARK